MLKPTNLKFLVASFIASLLMAGSLQAASNPFAEARPGSRLPSIAQDTSDKCAGMGKSAEEKDAAMQCGPGKCGAGMTESAKPDGEPMKGDKCGGASGSAKPGSQCGGGDKCGGGK
jgi:hypothetical protein